MLADVTTVKGTYQSWITREIEVQRVISFKCPHQEWAWSGYLNWRNFHQWSSLASAAALQCEKQLLFTGCQNDKLWLKLFQRWTVRPSNQVSPLWTANNSFLIYLCVYWFAVVFCDLTLFCISYATCCVIYCCLLHCNNALEYVQFCSDCQ